jgi:hypothetical protein
MTIFVDESDEAARAKYEDYLSYADLEGSSRVVRIRLTPKCGPYTHEIISKIINLPSII